VAATASVGARVYALALAGCFGFAGVNTGFQSGEVTLGGGSDSVALVPDGVGAVQVHVAITGSPPTDAVQNNVASGADEQASPKLTRELQDALKRPSGELRRLLNKLLPTSVSWLTAPGGGVVRTFARPPGLLDETVATLRASAALLSTVTPSSSMTVCAVSQAPGRPAKRHCTTRTNG
jgi:hypothetical protein